MDLLWGKIKLWLIEEYFYWIQGIEVGSRIERRMGNFQAKFERMMQRRGIALVVTKGKDDKVMLSFVRQNEFENQKKNMEDVLEGEGDKI